jgi:hypothetical protein
MTDVLTPEMWEQHHEYYADWRKALAAANTLTSQELEKPFQLHFYWRVGRPFTERQAMTIKSAILSQPRALINVWSNKDLHTHAAFREVAEHVRLRRYDPAHIAVGTPLEGRWDRLYKQDDKCWADGDIFRSLLLYKYGGVYYDMDEVLIRDLSPLLCGEFMYQWGTEIDQLSPAVMHFRKGSTFLLEALHRMCDISGGEQSTDLGTTLLTAVRRDMPHEFCVLPCVWVHPKWQAGVDMSNEGGTGPFTKNKHSDDDFPGCFSFHWHNRWEQIAEPGSKMDRLTRDVEERWQEWLK